MTGGCCLFSVDYLVICSFSFSLSSQKQLRKLKGGAKDDSEVWQCAFSFEFTSPFIAVKFKLSWSTLPSNLPCHSKLIITISVCYSTLYWALEMKMFTYVSVLIIIIYPLGFTCLLRLSLTRWGTWWWNRGWRRKGGEASIEERQRWEDSCDVQLLVLSFLDDACRALLHDAVDQLGRVSLLSLVTLIIGTFIIIPYY